MASKKREGLDGIKTTKGGTRREDRQITSKTVFDPIDITAKNALTVICMLQSPEYDVVVKALASLNTFASKADENLQLLTSLEIGSYLLPLIHHKESVIKRFAQKLIGELSSVRQFREEMLQIPNIVHTFADILEKEKDVVMHEFAALALASLSSDYEAASDLLKNKNCGEILFTRLRSTDPDVEKNCLEIMNHLLDDVFGIETLVEASNFDINLLVILCKSRYPVIQMLALEILTKFTAWNRDPKVLYAFRDAAGLETILTILETADWNDLHEGALYVMLNVADNPDLCDYLLQSGCLIRMLNILDNIDVNSSNERILGVLARMSQTKRGRIALSKINMVEKFCEYLRDESVSIQESACLGIANLAQYGPALESIIEADPIPRLIEIVINEANNMTLRNMAAYAINILCTEDTRAGKSVVNCSSFTALAEVLLNNDKLPAELCKNIVQILTAISFDDELRRELIKESIIAPLLSCIQGKNIFPLKDTSLQVDVLECLAGILIESDAMIIFLALNGMPKLLGCLRSKFASLREWGGHLVTMGCQSVDFIKIFINFGGLEWLHKEKNTRYSMPSWESALEAIFAKYLPAKFAFTGRLDLNDITEDGFYIITRQNVKFFLLENCFQRQCVPLHPVYFVNFHVPEDLTESTEETNNNSPIHAEDKSKSKIEEAKDMKRYSLAIETKPEKLDALSNLYSFHTIVSLTSDDLSCRTFRSEQFRTFAVDPYLPVYLEDLKKRISKEESAIGDASWHYVHPAIIKERARIIAQFVADEMAGTNPNAICCTQEKEKHISELKFQLGTNILPLGLIKTGSFLERAMLFKVLADQIGFPCALVRNEYGKCWIEVAIPSINVEKLPSNTRYSIVSSITNTSRTSYSRRATMDAELRASASTFYGDPESPYPFWFAKIKTEFYKGLPNQCLKTNALVDLIDEPGKIIMLNSFEAEEYLGISRSN